MDPYQIIVYLPLVIAALLTLAAPLVGRLLFIPKDLAQMPWWQQARSLHSLKAFQTSVIIYGVFPVIFLLSFYRIEFFTITRFSLVIPVAAYLALACFACSRNTASIMKKLRGNDQRKSSNMGKLAFIILFFSPMLLALTGAYLVPPEFSTRAFVMIGAILLFLIIWNIWLAVGFLRLIGGIVPAPERLKTIITEQAEQVGMKQNLPAAWEIKTEIANAFAFQTNHAVGFTSGALNTMSDNEIAAITRHELAHLTESPKVVLLRRLSPLVFLPLLFLSPVASIEPVYIFLLIFAMLILMRLNGVLMRRMENRADSEAADDSEEADKCYGGALLKLYQHNLTPAVLGQKAQTHPDLYDRLLALGIEPDFPRPKPPKRLLAIGLAVAYVLVASAVFWAIDALLLHNQLI